MRSALGAVRDPRLTGGLWLTCVAGMSFGVIDVLTPLRLSSLGASAVVIAAAFLGAAGFEAVLAPLVGRLADRRGRLAPVRLSLLAGIVVSLLLPTLRPASVLVVLVVVGLPAYGTLFVPATAMVSDSADRHRLHQGLVFGMSNLAWASARAWPRPPAEQSPRRRVTRCPISCSGRSSSGPFSSPSPRAAGCSQR